MNSYLHIKNFLGQEKTIELLGVCTPFSCKDKVKKDKELVEEPNDFIQRPEEGTGNYSSFGRRPSGIYQLPTSSRNIQLEAQRTSEKEERSQEPSWKVKRQSKLAQALPTRVWDPQIGTFSHGQCSQYGLDCYGIHSQRAGKDEQDLSMQMIQEIQLLKPIIDVQLGKFNAKLKKITSDISELKKLY
ncbi:hypothetical protein O181_095979 [Austropuccinia psidii MF-1]|uniref:Uncharacterized protein n=1 Tax=Austropuccinia psidii MF-1 TaxID=1389203 RepID=A0A9Q3PC96_9BASI|nr:hypothetical protein [Austropuccinia psidii MF-1]